MSTTPPEYEEPKPNNSSDKMLEQNQKRGPKRNRLAVAGAALAMTGVLGGLVSVAAASEQEATSARAVQTAQQRNLATQAGDGQETELESVTLGELADELERLGLEININSATEADDYGDDDYGDDGFDDDGDFDESQLDSDDDLVDPFEGMTDAEVDALSDEEFFERLEAAGIEPEYADDQDGEDSHSDDSHSDDSHSDDSHGEEEPAASLAVDGNKLDTSDVSPELAERANKIWERFAKLIPADQRQMVSRFELMPDNYEGAHVYPTDQDPTKWVLGVGGGLGEDLDYVLIHEFGHLLTLQAKEVPPSADGDSCTTYYTGEGCALKGSTFAEFVQKFWPKEMLDTITELYENEDYDGLDAFYEKNKDRFVTDYAATNPGEDLAETFAHFVTEDRPTGDSIADQKVQLLWADEDMVELRDQIRKNL